ncbi:DEAD/DEAH box helicase [Pleomorphovibrio marinus]|uniref:DEAD/DEAH box helicase n=1 Tax=Pleomorphovibrio marinus TaxID=2164132 RepID=UPI000E0BA466|nr:DEAD/DEAH box helicase [Pleomorphovibrio marinus]
MTAKAKKSKSNKSEKKKNTIPYHRKPDNLSLDEWQIGLRRQFASLQEFSITNLGAEAVFSDYSVYNPQTDNSYKVAIRSNPEEIASGKNFNFCTCYDFKTNGLGTCKHIEAVIGQIQRKKSTHSQFSKGNFQPTYSSVYLEYGPDERKVKIRIGSEEARKLNALSKKYFSENGTIKSTAFEKFDEFLTEAKSIQGSFRCYEDALTYIFEVREKNRRKAWIWKNQNGLENGLLSQYIKAELHPYQKKGVAFAVEAGRALIADEMGLGKTLQAIAASEVLKKEFGIQKVLIVCPTSLKYQWKSEIEKFTDSTVHVIEGLKLKRDPQYADDNMFYKIVGHHTVGNDLDVINATEFDLIILDEAQRIKNWKAKISQNIKKLESEYAIVLTGTPLENKLEELYSVVQFINPFRLGALYRFLHDHQVTEPETSKVIGYKDLNKIGNILSDILIRRTKRMVLQQLPSRQDKNLFVIMTDKQREVHNESYDLVCRLVNKWRKMGFLPEKDRQRLMINLNMMRMVCNSTYILDQQTRHDTKIAELMGILEEIFQMQGEKVVIFSQWERMTRLVARELDDMGIHYENLHGGIPSKDRKSLLDNFLKDPECKVFLSTDAGGVGLNLQSAAYLINLDIPWNPAVLEQRIARIYRIGQKKKVNIINLVTTDSIEHRMLDVLKFKSSMAEGVLDAGDDTILMQEDRFKQFMNSVETMVDEKQTFTEASVPEPENEEKNEEPYQTAPSSDKRESDQIIQLGLFDTDIPEKPNPKPAPPPKQETGSTGMEWMSQLSKVLGSPAQTKAMVSSLTEKDSQTGKTYLKLPVENEEAVENVLKGIGQLFQAIDWSKFGK